MLKLGSRRQLDFDLRDPESQVLNNFNRLATTLQETLPVHNTLPHFIGHVGAVAFAWVRTLMIRRLIRMRLFDHDRVGNHLVVGVDGTGMLSFQHRHCPYCLTQKHGEKTRYFHPVLEAKLLTTSSGLALSMGSEFIENPVPAGPTQDLEYANLKQDCELKAFARLAPQLRKEFPQTPILITSDALYACGAAIQICKDCHFGFVFTFKPGRLPSVWEDFLALLKQCPQNTKRLRLPNGTRQLYRWVNDLSYQDTENRQHTFDAFLCEETTPTGETITFAWITERRVTADNVVMLAEKGGRSRSKIENEGFNVQKNSGLNLEHPYTTKEVYWKAFYYLLQIAHIMLQLLEKGSLLEQIARQRGKSVMGLLGSLKNIPRRLLECFRYFRIPDAAYDAEAVSRIQIRLDSS